MEVVSIKTNDYMNNVLRNAKVTKMRDSNLGEFIFRWKDGRVIPIKVDYGYHRGDLGKGRDTYFWNIESSNRSSGHYGTGTYFFSKEADERESEYFGERPLHKINFNEYNLFKPQNEEDARILHGGLRAVNYLKELDKYQFDNMRFMLKRYGIKDEDISNAYYKARDVYYSDKYQKSKYDEKLDSISTVFMKELGFNGIDVRKLRPYDNSSFGSVIYDLEKKKK